MKSRLLVGSALAASLFFGVRLAADTFVTILPTTASTATVTSRWAIGAQQAGLGYIDSNSGFPGATGTNFFTLTGAAIGAGGSPSGFTSYLPTGAATPQSSVGNALRPSSYSGLTYVADNLGLIGPLSFYAIHHALTGDYLALIQPSVPTVSDQKPMSAPGGPATLGASGYFALSYAADNPGGWGAELFYYFRTNTLGQTVFGSLVPALLSGPTDRWNLGSGRGFTDLAYTSTDLGLGFGASQFYYLRLDPVTQTTFFGHLNPSTGVATDIQNLGGVFHTLVFTTTNVGYGANNFYSIGQGLQSQVITFGALANHTACDAPFTFVAPVSTSGLAVTLTLTGPATLSGGNLLTLTGATGTVTLTASQAGNGSFAAALPVAQSFTVAACAAPVLSSQSIVFGPIGGHTACDAPFTFVAPVATSGLPVSLAITGPATLSAGNVLTLTGATGTVTLTASQAGNGSYSPATSVTQSFTVAACAAPALSSQSIVFGPIGGHTACDAPFTFVAPVATSGLPVSLAITGPATLSAGNVLTLTGATGTVTLTASQAGNGSYSPATSVAQSFTVTACAAPVLSSQSIAFGAFGGHTVCDAAFTFVAPVATSGLPVSLAITGPATLSGGNVLTLTGATGTVTLTASQAGNGSYSPATSVTQSFAVTVCAAPPPGAQTISFGALASRTSCDGPFTVILPTSTSGLPVSLTLSGPATLSSLGLMTLTGAVGTVTLTATQAGNATYAAALPVTQSFQVSACTAVVPIVTSEQDIQPYTPVNLSAFGIGRNEIDGTVGTPFTYQITANNSPTSFGALLVPPGLSLNPSTGLISGTPTAVNTWFTTVTASNAAGTGDALVIIVIAPAGTAPVITSQRDILADPVNNPSGTGVGINAVTGTVGVPLSYQIAGTGTPTSFSAASLPPGLTLNSLTGVISGTPTVADTWYSSVQATNAVGSGVATVVFVIAPVAFSRIVNLSALAPVASGSQALFMGFAISGTGKSVLLRGVGPGLTAFGVPNVLPDPLLSLFGPVGPVATNAQWQTPLGGQSSGALIAAASAQLGAFALTSGSGDTALLLTLPSGVYSTILASQSGKSGTALDEIYDADLLPGSRLINVSVRTTLAASGSSVPVGMVIAGNTPKTVLIRADGPALAVFGVPGVLSDPQLTIAAGAAPIVPTATWAGGTAAAAQIASTAAQVGAFPWAAGSADAAMLVTLPPGTYTISVTSAHNLTGAILIEIYDTL